MYTVVVMYREEYLENIYSQVLHDSDRSKEGCGYKPTSAAIVLGPFAASAPSLYLATFSSEFCRWATLESHR